MKKYSKPVVKACEIRMASILADSLGLNGSHGTTQYGNDRKKIIDEEEEEGTLSW